MFGKFILPLIVGLTIIGFIASTIVFPLVQYTVEVIVIGCASTAVIWLIGYVILHTCTNFYKKG